MAGLARLSDRFVSCCWVGELVLQRIDSCQVVLHAVVAAPLVRSQPQPACGIGPSGPGTTEMNHSAQVLLLLERDRADLSRSYRLGDPSIQQRRSQLDGMAWHDARVEAVEPARSQVVPRADLDHHVVVDAIARRLAEGPVGDLKHANRARRRLVPLQGIPHQLPSPVCPCHRIPSALDLRQRGKELRCDGRGRMLAEEGFVLLPRLDRAFVE